MPPVETTAPATEKVESQIAQPVPLEDLSEAQHRKWLETGDLPVKGAKEIKTLDEQPDAKKADAADDAKNADDSGESASREKKGAGSLTYRELRARVRELEAKLENASKSERAEIREEIAELEEPAKPKTEKLRARPRSNDQADGKPKYKDWNEYEDDLDKWYDERADLRIAETLSKREQEATIASQNRKIEQSWNDRTAKARETHDDFDDVALDPEGPGKHISRGSVVDQWILESDLGAEILYHFGQNLDDLLRYGKLSPVAAARELTKLEAKLSGEPEAKTPAQPEPKVTKAPKPASIVGGRGTTAVDDVTKALRDDPTKSEDAMRRFMDAENRANIKERLGDRR